jgi:hypothetical protein
MIEFDIIYWLFIGLIVATLVGAIIAAVSKALS